MAFAPITTKTVLGGFVEKEFGHNFEYVASDHPDVFNEHARRHLPFILYSSYKGEQFPHEVFVGCDQSRYARVLKTVAYVVVDEDENGPVIEKWNIRHTWQR